MAKRTHYEVLGIEVRSTSDEIKSAYRKIVLAHHPDTSKNSESPAIFMSATEAYDILSDSNKRKSYDSLLRTERLKKEQERLRFIENDRSKRGTSTSSVKRDFRRVDEVKVTGPAVPKTQAPDSANFKHGSGSGPSSASVTLDITRLTMVFNRGQMHDAEQMARKILRTDARQPIPYAVLGDISRQRGDLDRAAEMYALAVQMDPRNTLYRDRYEELLATAPRGGLGKATYGVEEVSARAQGFALMAALAVVVLGSGYVVLSREPAILPSTPFIGTWTLGLVVMLFLCGVTVGAAFSVAALLDRFSTMTTTTLGKMSPSVALAFIAIVNFWAAAILYLGIGYTQKAFNFSTTRVVSTVGGITVLISLAAAISVGINPIQTFLWGGNVAYLGCLCGWMVSDSFRR